MSRKKKQKCKKKIMYINIHKRNYITLLLINSKLFLNSKFKHLFHPLKPVNEATFNLYTYFHCFTRAAVAQSVESSAPDRRAQVRGPPGEKIAMFANSTWCM